MIVQLRSSPVPVGMKWKPFYRICIPSFSSLLASLLLADWYRCPAATGAKVRLAVTHVERQLPYQWLPLAGGEALIVPLRRKAGHWLSLSKIPSTRVIRPALRSGILAYFPT